MGFSISTDFTVDSFFAAESKYNNTKPIRGKEWQDIRPLGKRSAQHMRIVKINDDAYACRLYNTDVVTYYRDGRVEVTTGGWDTQSTRAFMQACLPWRYSAYRVNNYLHIYDSKAGAYYVMSGVMTIDTNTGEITGYKVPTKSVVDREATKPKREIFKPFLKFAKVYIETLQMEIPRPESYGWLSDKRSELATYIKDEEAIPEDKYLEMLVELANHQYWRSISTVTYDEIKRQVYKATTVYKDVELPIGYLQGR